MRSSRRKTRKRRRSRSKRYGGSVMNIDILDKGNESITNAEEELRNCDTEPCRFYWTRFLQNLKFGRNQHTRQLGQPGKEAYFANHNPLR